ncbi:uncharacterized protein BDFB_002744 [Asbolus verrucosus]|uniref:Uncharacterized protein n=1 Tax=Asbolus verrucosus TaxID=1661398 RepID=A0A482V9X0_ASBVE|nr:uncharacterized protein BDFB_002744 [Asbolus verrucosus]
MATALMLGNGLKSQKNQEKRATNSTALDDDERGPKRRLVRSATGKMQKSAEDDAAGLHDAPKINDEEEESENNITVDIKTKTVEETEEEKLPEAANSTTATTPVDGSDAAEKPETDEGEPQFGSVKEKQCWDMYCKMADKGLKVSYDTILRGMLTPTEYRMRRKESIVNVAEDVTNAH